MQCKMKRLSFYEVSWGLNVEKERDDLKLGLNRAKKNLPKIYTISEKTNKKVIFLSKNGTLVLQYHSPLSGSCRHRQWLNTNRQRSPCRELAHFPADFLRTAATPSSLRLLLTWTWTCKLLVTLHSPKQGFLNH